MGEVDPAGSSGRTKPIGERILEALRRAAVVPQNCQTPCPLECDVVVVQPRSARRSGSVIDDADEFVGMLVGREPSWISRNRRVRSDCDDG